MSWNFQKKNNLRLEEFIIIYAFVKFLEVPFKTWLIFVARRGVHVLQNGDFKSQNSEIGFMTLGTIFR